jgi:hypothetical protein
VTAAPIHLAGALLHLDCSGALWWPAERTLVVADLHLEKGSAAAVRGHLVPPYDSRATLDRLSALMRRYRPGRVVALGDSFHDRHAEGRMAREDAARLARLTEQAEFVWVSGNHDPEPCGQRGNACAEWRLDGLVFRHDGGGDGAEISGHLHPKAGIATRGKHVSRPCFVTDGRRLVLPAFGAYAGGLDVTDPAVARLFPRGGRVFLLGQQRLFSFALGPLRRAG